MHRHGGVAAVAHQERTADWPSGVRAATRVVEPQPNDGRVGVGVRVRDGQQRVTHTQLSVHWRVCPARAAREEDAAWRCEALPTRLVGAAVPRLPVGAIVGHVAGKAFRIILWSTHADGRVTCQTGHHGRKLLMQTVSPVGCTTVCPPCTHCSDSSLPASRDAVAERATRQPPSFASRWAFPADNKD
eukprot:scaffold30769_cov71-Phaeocystis_antarctica.AAC.1